MSEIKLLPCPFCGGEAELESNGEYAVVGCKNSNCQGYACCYKYDSKGEAIEHWNTRKPMERILTRLEDIKKVNPSGRIGHPKVVTSETIRVTDKAIEIVKEEGGIDVLQSKEY